MKKISGHAIVMGTVGLFMGFAFWQTDFEPFLWFSGFALGASMVMARVDMVLG